MSFPGWRRFPEKNPIDLWRDPPGFDPAAGQDPPTVTPYLLKGPGRGCVIVFPGGGYAGKALHEAEPIARWLNSLGVSAFVLDYRVAPYRAPVPYLDAARAVRTVRTNAAEWGVDPDKIGVLGFSAGGHLAACAATMYDGGDPASPDPVERAGSRPDAAILCYPVISLRAPFCHGGSRDNLLGPGADGPAADAWSPDLHARPGAPPMFLWHTFDDEAVPYHNSLRMASAARDAGARAELHVYPEGRHGLALAEGLDCGRWTGECAAFLRNLGFW